MNRSQEFAFASRFLQSRPMNVDQSFFFPASMIKVLEAEAVRLDTTLSECVSFAWTNARMELQSSSDALLCKKREVGIQKTFGSDLGDSIKRSVSVPQETLTEVKDFANKFDRSLSWTMQNALLLSLDDLRRKRSVV
ncbi:MAG: hypothetical protein KBF88_00845 [Polyangiaceae bacterium]|nr:hypothetical protein [Polyangiaceae bacterium]